MDMWNVDLILSSSKKVPCSVLPKQLTILEHRAGNHNITNKNPSNLNMKTSSPTLSVKEHVCFENMKLYVLYIQKVIEHGSDGIYKAFRYYN